MTEIGVQYIRTFSSLSGVTDILNVAIFKYSLHKFREMILHRKCQLI